MFPGAALGDVFVNLLDCVEQKYSVCRPLGLNKLQ